MSRVLCGCGRSFRSQVALERHLAGKRPSLHAGWFGDIDNSGPIPRLTGGAVPIIDQEDVDHQLRTGPQVPLKWHEDVSNSGRT